MRSLAELDSSRRQILERSLPHGSELAQRLADFGCELQGYAGTLYKGDPSAIDDGEWQKLYLNSYSLTIAGGTSEIVRNVLGEKVLGLPKTR